MAWIRTVAPPEATGELAECYDHIKTLSGGVIANILTAQSLNPLALRTHHGLYRAVMFGPSELSRAQREMIAVVVSATNRCHY